MLKTSGMTTATDHNGLQPFGPQQIATDDNTPQRTATDDNGLQRTASDHNRLQRTATATTDYNGPQRTGPQRTATGRRGLRLGLALGVSVRIKG